MCRFRLLIPMLAFIAMLTACGGSSSKQGEGAANDSVMQENRRLNTFLDIVATSMDSINGREKMLFVNKEGVPLSNMQQIHDNIKLFKFTLDEQKKKIEELQSQLDQKDNAQVKKFQTIINNLQKIIEEKEKMIAQLQKELEQKNVNIAQLEQHVGRLSENVNTLSQANQKKDKAIEAANTEIEKLSVGYVKIGSKKLLSSSGILKGGFLKKKKVDLNSLDKSQFRKVNVSTDTEFTVSASKIKLLTSHPSSSYSISEHGSTCVLTIHDTSSFWGTSKFLVIQTD